MKKLILLLATSLICTNLGNHIERCENEEVVCYVYDTGWSGFSKGGRGAGISCKFKESENE